MPKPDKNNASNGFTLGYEVLQNCRFFFQVDFGYRLDLKIELEEGLIPIYHYRRFLGSLGHQNSSLREAQSVHYFSMVLN